MKRIWLLEPIDPNCRKPGSSSYRFSYDAYHGFVVCAETEGEAREIASGNPGDEGADSWTDIAITSCEDIGIANDSTSTGIVLADMRAG